MTRLSGVSTYPPLLPEGRDDSTSIVLVRQAAVARANAISGDVVDWSPRRTHNQWSGSASGYTQYRVRPYATVDEEDIANQQYQLTTTDVFHPYSNLAGTYASAAAQYEFYANMLSAQYGRSLDIYA